MTDRPNPIVQLTLWRVRDFTREPEALFWVFAFPIVLAFALGLAFKNRGAQVVRIGVEAGAGAEVLAQTLDAAPKVEARVYHPADAGNRLRAGRGALVGVPGDPVGFRYDSTRPESLRARLGGGAVLRGGG